MKDRKDRDFILNNGIFCDGCARKKLPENMSNLRLHCNLCKVCVSIIKRSKD